MLRRKVERFLQTQRVSGDSFLLIGFSGGPDSTCLTALLADIAPRKHFRIACAYLDHGLRPAAERRAEADQVASFCRERGIRLFTRALEEGALEEQAHRSGLSLEESARRARSEYFLDLKREQPFTHLALGHNLDDQLETVLYRIFQGSGPGGVRGIRARAGWIIRPLLKITRREISRYLAERRIDFVTDSTNNETRFLRNRVRNKVVPALREVFPGMGRSLDALRCKSAMIDDYVAHQAAEALAWQRTARGVNVDAEDFRCAPPALRLYALYQAAGMLFPPGGRAGKQVVPFRFLKPLLVSGGRLPRNLNLQGHGLSVRLSEHSLFLERSIVVNGKKGYFIPIHPGIPVPLSDYQLVLRLPEEVTTRMEEVICAFNAEKVTFPIVVRSRRPGDGIDLGYGTKKLKKLFNEQRIDKTERDVVPVLEDAAGILAVLGTFVGVKNVVRHGAQADAVPGSRGPLTVNRLPAAARPEA